MGRHSIAGLMAFVLIIALGLASVRYASKLWEDIAALSALLVLSTATVAAWRGRSSAAWAGFATFGWSAAVLLWGAAMLDAANQPRATVGGIPAVPATPLTGLLEALYPYLHHAPPAGEIVGVPVPAIRAGFVYAYYQRVGHIVACLLFGLLGAVVGRVVAGRAPPPPPAHPGA